MKFFSISALLVLLSSCGGEGIFECTSGAGKNIRKEIPLSEFSNIKIHQAADIVLKEGNEYKAVIFGSENLVHEVALFVRNNWLEIDNTNYCSWTNKNGNPKIEITCPSLDSLWTYDYSNVTSLGALNYDSLWIKSKGSGDINLELNSTYANIRCEFVSVISLKGTAQNIFVHYTENGIFRGEDLICDIVQFIHDGSHDLHFYPTKAIYGGINSTGHVIIHNNVESIHIDQRGLGKVYYH